MNGTALSSRNVALSPDPVTSHSMPVMRDRRGVIQAPVVTQLFAILRNEAPLNNPSFEFFRAIARHPASSIVDGLRAEDLGNPNLDGMLAAHADYVAALK